VDEAHALVDRNQALVAIAETLLKAGTSTRDFCAARLARLAALHDQGGFPDASFTEARNNADDANDALAKRQIELQVAQSGLTRAKAVLSLVDDGLQL
jgi:multidrug resistance efflux pump